MKKEIKFKSTDDLFVDYLKNNNMTSKGIYDIKAEDLKKFFNFQTEDQIIKISISDFKEQFYKDIIFKHVFIFYKEPKIIEEYDSPELLNKNTVSFQTIEVEENFLIELEKRKNKLDIEFFEKNNWIKKNLSSLDDNYYSKSKYRIINYKKDKETEIKFCRYYYDYAM